MPRFGGIGITVRTAIAICALGLSAVVLAQRPGNRDPGGAIGLNCELVRADGSGQEELARAQARVRSAGKELPGERENYGEVLAKYGRYKEALSEYLWCLDVGMVKDGGYSGVRRSFLMSDMIDLGQKYPPAFAAIRSRRDTARAKILGGANDPDVAIDLAVYNEALHAPGETLALYEAIKSRRGPVPHALFEEVRPALVEKQRYGELIAGYGSPLVRVRRAIKSYFRGIGKSGMFHDPDRPLANLYVARKQMMSTRQKCEEVYGVLLHLGRIGEARSVRNTILGFDPRPIVYSEIIWIARTAHSRSEASAVRNLARARLKASELREALGGR